MQEEAQQAKGPLPRSREAVDWWLKKWGRTEPLTREVVWRLIENNKGVAAGLDLNDRNLRGADLSYINLENAKLKDDNLKDAVLNFADLRDADLMAANLQNADLTGANLQRAVLSWVNLQNANLWGANLQSADLCEANIQSANLSGADLQDAYLSGIRIYPDTNLEGVKWDKNYISVLEREGQYEAAIALYRRLKEWYRGAGMLKIAGEFHYREEEAITKARGQQLWSEFKQIGSDFREFRQGLKAAWQQLKKKDTDTQLKE